MKIYKSRLFIHLWYKNQWEKEKVIFNSHVPFACLCQRIVNETSIHLLHVLLFLDIDWFSFSRVSWLFIINKTGCFFHITSVCCFGFCCWIVEFNSNLCSLNSLISFCFSRVLLKWWSREEIDIFNLESRCNAYGMSFVLLLQSRCCIASWLSFVWQPSTLIWLMTNVIKTNNW